MDRLFFEDFAIGDAREFGGYRVERDEILSFAREFDPQPFHLDEAAASASLLRGLAASGWHTLAILMRLSCEAWILRSASLGSAGVEEAQWREPVRPGDVLRARMRVLDARASRTRPAMGLLTIESEAFNQNGAVVARARHVNLLTRRAWKESSARAATIAAPDFAPPPSAAPCAALAGYFEDVELGRVQTLGSYHFRRDDMLRFARAYDPQPFHLDDDAAARSRFGRLTASGWHTASAFMRCLVDARDRAAAQAQAQGKAPAPGGPSPGFRDLRWLKPVCVDDRVAYFATPTQKRPTRRPGWGLVFAENHGVNQAGVTVFAFASAAFYPMR